MIAKKFSIISIFVIMLLSLPVLLTACGHAHVFTDKWTYDDDHHWHKCEQCDEKAGIDEHDYDENGVCEVCGSKRPSSNLFFHYDETTDSYSVSGMSKGPEIDIVIPSTHENKPVTAIGREAFDDCESMTSVIIPDSVTLIDYRAFSGCCGLTSVTLGAGVTNIEFLAFEDCYKLIEVYNRSSLIIEAGSSKADFLGYYAKNVYREDGQSKLVNENGFTFYIDEEKGENYLMNYKGSETSLTLPEDKSYAIYDYAFYNCMDLTSVTIPNNVTSIGENAFNNCRSLTNVTVGDGVTSLGKNAFYDCYRLESVTLGDGLMSLGESAFAACPALVSVTLGEKLTSIGENAFNQCKLITSITLPNGLQSIGDSAFNDCDGLTSMIIPDTVTSIGRNAFEDCDNLESVTLGNGLTEIQRGTFYGCGSLTSVNIPNTVTSIGSDAFARCYSITNVIIPDNVTSIGAGAFRECYNLTGVIIPDNVTIIEASTFRDCHDLVSVTIGSGVKEIENWAFENCYKLIEVYNRSSLKIEAGSEENGRAGYYAKNIYGTDGRSKLVDEDGFILYVDEETNENYLMLYVGDGTSVTLPEGVNYAIFDSAFYDCDTLTSVKIPNNVTRIGYRAFEDCDNITFVSIGDGVTEIGEHAFYDCDKLNAVEFTKNVETIGEDAFEYGDLKSIYFHGTNKDWLDHDYTYLIEGGHYYYNTALMFADLYYYSADDPELLEDYNPIWKYFHYNEDGEIEIWE